MRFTTDTTGVVTATCTNCEMEFTMREIIRDLVVCRESE